MLVFFALGDAKVWPWTQHQRFCVALEYRLKLNIKRDILVPKNMQKNAFFKCLDLELCYAFHKKKS